MHRLWKWIGWIIIPIWCLCGCQPTATAAISPPLTTPQLVFLQHSLSLTGLTPIFHDCAVEQGDEFAIIVEERPTPALDIENTDMVFRFGAPAALSAFAAVMGQEKLAFTVNPLNPIASLSDQQLREIFSAQVNDWESLDPSGAFSGEIEVWAYPQDEDIQVLANQILAVDMAAPSSFLAPDPLAMQQAIAGNPLAIGILPVRWLNSSVKALEPAGELDAERVFPILMITKNQPEGRLKTFALCIQASLSDQ